MTQKEINKTIQEYKDYQLMIKSVEREMDHLKEKLIKHMENKKLEVIEVDAGKASYKHVLGSRFDAKRFSEENKNLYKTYQVPTDNMRFQVS
ncbi:hypothetical protein [Butyrivibrio sp. INlla21]|uniref:hypothetical protein n=1 Tax=Butyrivibrio sp. INlla21 TaxID=1520811 RepID=UPI0008E8D28C|nr:hypothetical protein [Butyrivibrio sp. INlla21]SFU37114.1 hypothetical protein SAMN02910342_00291 [Butyrivibrio sp. INlla21]